MLELRGVDGWYGQIQAVRNFNLNLEAGKSVALLGRNGAGKTTTLRLIAGVIKPARGEVIWDGNDVSQLPPEERVRHGIVLVPEGRGIFPALTVHENLRFGAYWEKPKRPVLNQRMDYVFSFLPKLATLRNQQAGSLSGGEQQMVAVGRALMSNPKVLLLDEPSLGLAPMVVESLYELFAQLLETGIGLVLVEQYIGFALKLCDDVIGLNKGNIIVQGRADDLAGSDQLREMYMGGAIVDDVLV
jgi:branched-chain amino acid transport system ATP-binding protein